MTACLIDWLNSNAPAIQVFSSAIQAFMALALVGVTIWYAISVKRHIDQDRDLFELQRQDLQARLRADNLEATRQIIGELCKNHIVKWYEDAVCMDVRHCVSAEATLTNVGANLATIGAVDDAYAAILALLVDPDHVASLPEPLPLTVIGTKVTRPNFDLTQTKIVAAVDALEDGPATSGIVLKFKMMFNL